MKRLLAVLALCLAFTFNHASGQLIPVSKTVGQCTVTRYMVWIVDARMEFTILVFNSRQH